MDKFIIKRPRLESVESQAESSSTSAAEKSEISNEKKVSVKGRKFQNSWKSKHPWIFYKPEVDKAFCSICQKCTELNVLKCSRKEGTFISDGFSKWKHALEAFRTHERSECHRESVEKSHFLEKCTNVSTQISDTKKAEMIVARDALNVIFTSLLYLSRQGLPIRGHEDEESNLRQLLLVRSKESQSLLKWMSRPEKYKWLSPVIQNEILEIMAHQVLRNAVKDVKKSLYFALVVDETADMSNQEQVSISIRHVDDSLKVYETFVGFYATESTTAESLFKLIKDALIRICLSLDNCRGQCYDGASNFAGMHAGVQERIKQQQPRALFVHCSAHRLNLTVQDIMQEVSLVRDTMNTVKELVNFVKESPARMALFHKFKKTQNTDLRPLCPTRWLMRVSSVISVLKNYAEIMNFLEHASNDKSNKPLFASKCSGFLKQLERFDFYFTLKAIVKILGPTEEVNKSVQSPSTSLRNVERQIEMLCLVLMEERSEEKFSQFWEEIKKEAKDLALDEPKLPRVRKIPNKIDDHRNTHVFQSTESYFRKIFYEVVDGILGALHNRYSGCPAFSKMKKIEEEIVKFLNSTEREMELESAFQDFCSEDVDIERLHLHCSMLRDILKQKSVKIENMSKLKDYFLENEAASSLLTEIKKLLKLFYVVPATSCTAERSFSLLRRLKTFLRTTMGQTRLNHTAILNTHIEYVDDLKTEMLVNEFVKRNSHRKQTFALF